MVKAAPGQRLENGLSGGFLENVRQMLLGNREFFRKFADFKRFGKIIADNLPHIFKNLAIGKGHREKVGVALENYQ